MSTVIIRKTTYKALTVPAAIAAAVLLPQLFHLIGAVSGTGAAVGAAFLPMHLPVLLAAFLAGPAVGLAVGALSPVVSFLLTGMPSAALLPFMALELAAYGLFGGMLAKTKLNGFVKLLLTQLSGRAVRAAAVLVSVFLLGNSAVGADTILSMITAGIYGILIQWAVVPLVLAKTEKLRRE